MFRLPTLHLYEHFYRNIFHVKPETSRSTVPYTILIPIVVFLKRGLRAPRLRSTSSIVQVISMAAKEELTCTHCKELFTDPRTLECLHTFCAKCLLDGKKREVNGPQPFPHDGAGEEGPERGPEKFVVTCLAPGCGISYSAETVEKIENELKTDHFLQRVRERFDILSSPDPRCDKCDRADNHAVGFCIQCSIIFCQICLNAHNRQANTEKHGTVTMQQMWQKSESVDAKHGTCDPLEPFAVKKKWKCTEHMDLGLQDADSDVSLLCLDCNHMICRSCITTDHLSHRREFAKLLLERRRYQEYQEQIYSPFEDLIQVQENVAKMIDMLNDRKEELTKKRRRVKDIIEEKLETMCKGVEEQKEVLLGRVQDIYTRKSEYLGKEIKDFEDLNKETSRILGVVENTLDVSLPTEILHGEKDWIERMKHLQKKSEDHPKEPNECDTFILSIDSTPLPAGVIGSVFSNPHPLSFTVEGISEANFIAGNETDIFVTCRDFIATPLLTSDLDISVELHPHAGGQKVHGNVQNDGNGKYVITLEPRIAGEHTLQVIVRDVDEELPLHLIPIHVSPIPNPEATLNSIISKEQIPQMKDPARVAVNQYNTIVVSDREAHMLFVLNEEGECQGWIGGPGEGRLEFQEPHGVAFLTEDKIVVADTNNHRIQIVSINGEFITEFGNIGTYPSEFMYPEDVDVLQHNMVVCVVDRLNHRIQFFKQDGTYLGSFGRWDIFDDLYSICVGMQDTILLAECNRNPVRRVQHHKKIPLNVHQDPLVEHAFLPSFVHLYVSNTILEPQGEMVQASISYDPTSRYVFLADGSYTMKLYTGAGKLVRSVNVVYPETSAKICSIAFMSESRVVVCDSANKRVVILSVF